MRPRPAVLLTSHIYAAPTNRVKPDALRAAGVELTVVTAARWKESLFDVPPSPDGQLVTLPTLFTGRNNAFLYRAKLRRILLQVRPDILHIEQEPISMVTGQWLWAAHGLPLKITFFTWENMKVLHTPNFAQEEAKHYSALRRWAWQFYPNQIADPAPAPYPRVADPVGEHYPGSIVCLSPDRSQRV